MGPFVVKDKKETVKVPEDGTARHALFLEPAVDKTGVLTVDGVENIARHKYVPGVYTVLDNALNPGWTWLTENMLPLWLAPNAVTTMGGLHCGLAYCILWYYSPNFDQLVPDWTLLLSGYCIIAYYTFDCMDGKQARRTGSSSPLGQLFDHGMDCICLMAFIANINGLVMLGSRWCMVLQCGLQFAFFMAQWEEYHTHVLPHSVGGVFGVTEVNYGLGVFTIFNAFLDRQKFWGTPMDQLISFFPAGLLASQFSMICTYTMYFLLVIGSLLRVVPHPRVQGHRWTALGQLSTPITLCFIPAILPESVLVNETRYISIATGLAFSLLTNKIIVFSMAKMTFATTQIEAIPLIVVISLLSFNTALLQHSRIILQLTCIWYFYRLHKWSYLAIHQICRRLDIYCFSIKHPKKTS